MKSKLDAQRLPFREIVKHANQEDNLETFTAGGGSTRVHSDFSALRQLHMKNQA